MFEIGGEDGESFGYGAGGADAALLLDALVGVLVLLVAGDFRWRGRR